MAKEFVISINDDMAADLKASNAAVENGGIEGLFKKVIKDAVEDVRRQAVEVAKPAIKEVDVAKDITSTVKLTEEKVAP